ncbi:MAG: hypothetical protein Kow00107_06280 [Planctomycetota bacterium]
MAYFDFKQKQSVELFKAPEVKGLNKQLISIGLLFILAVVGMLWSLFASKNRPSDLPQPSSSSAVSQPVTTPPKPISSYLQPSSPKNKVELNPAILNDVFDEYSEEDKGRNVEELTNLEREPYLHVLNYLQTHTEEEIRNALTIPHPKLHPEVTYYDMTSQPSKVRGATVRVAGKIRLLGYAEFEADFQAASGLHGIWYGNLFDRFNQQYAVRFIDNPDNIKEGDSIELTGVFLKRYWMLSRRSEFEERNVYSIMPAVIAKAAYIAKEPPIPLLTPERLLFLVISAVMVLALGFVLSREIMGEQRRRLRREQRKHDSAVKASVAKDAPSADEPQKEGADKGNEKGNG